MTATTPFLKGSPAPRYWNMARQRYCRRLARYRNTRSVSADPGAKPAAHTRAESRGFGPSKVDAAERQTLRWRDQDSNHRSRVTRAIFECRLWLVPANRKVGAKENRHTKRRALPPRNRWFESRSLQRGVCEPRSLSTGWLPPARHRRSAAPAFSTCSTAMSAARTLRA